MLKWSIVSQGSSIQAANFLLHELPYDYHIFDLSNCPHDLRHMLADWDLGSICKQPCCLSNYFHH